MYRSITILLNINLPVFFQPAKSNFGLPNFNQNNQPNFRKEKIKQLAGSIPLYLKLSLQYSIVWG
jgi:hypothetical protein